MNDRGRAQTRIPLQAHLQPVLSKVYLRPAAVALLVASAYYIGAQIGLALRFQSSTISAIWPPNAVLLAALLLTPPRRWWVYLLAAIPAHIAALAPAGVPVWRLAWQITSNFLFAAVAAHSVHHFTARPLHFDRLRQVAVFLAVAVFAAPGIVTFVTPAPALAFVSPLFDLRPPGGNYWLAWRQVFLSNVLANLTLAPAILLWATHGRTWIRQTPPWRYVEASLLAVGLLAAIGIAFGINALPANIPALVYSPLPLLLWAALRFGPGGVSPALMALTFLSIWNASHGRGPFLTAATADENVLALQVFVIAISPPMLLLAALVRERQQAEAALRRSESALQQSEERFRRAVLDAPIPIMIHAEDGEVLQINRAWSDQTGYTQAEIGTIAAWAERVGTATMQANLEQVHAGASPALARVYTITTRSGERRSWEIRSAPLGRAPDGRRLAISMALDTTERERSYQLLEQRVAKRTAELAQANAALREREELFRVTFEQLPVGVSIVGLDHSFMRVSDTMCQIMGYTRDELLRTNPWSLIHPDDRAATEPFLRQLASDSDTPAKLELRAIRKDGQIVWHRESGRLIRSDAGWPRFYLVTTEDVTARRQAEEALREHSHFIERITQATPEIVYVYDLAERRHVYTNREIGAVLGYTPEETRAFGADLLPALLHPDDQALFAAQLDLIAAAADTDTIEFEYRMRHRDGTYRWFASRRVVFARDAAGKPRQFLGVTTDITRRKSAELALQTTNATLREHIDELSALNQITQALTLWADLPQALERIGPLMIDLFKAAEISIGLLDESRTSFTRLLRMTAAQTAMIDRSLDSGTVTLRVHVRMTAGQTAVIDLSPPLTDDPHVRRAIRRGKMAVIPHGKLIHLEAGAVESSQEAPAGCQLLLPIQARGAVIGLLHILATRPGHVYTPTRITLAQTVASTLANAIENARLFANEQHQRQIAESLREVAAALTSSLDLETVLRTLFEQLRRVVAYDGAAIFLPDGEALVVAEGIGIGEQSVGRWVPLAERDPAVQVFLKRCPQVIANTAAHPDWTDWDVPQPIRSWMGAPLLIGAAAIGVLTADNTAPYAYGADDLQVLQAFAAQAAIAIDNARRYQQAHLLAAEQERQRLARDLHDSVSLALFSANLTADVLPQLWERDPAKGRRALGDLRRLTRGAQAEMRTLLVELRPSALARTPLDELLAHLAAVASAKTNSEVDLGLDRAPALPADVQVALYRIAQEALNNIVKHAQAGRITVQLQVDPVATNGDGIWRGAVALQIADDGRGFDPAVAAHGGCGLDNMRERAAGIGAALQLNSRPGAGTQICIAWRGVGGSPKEMV